MVSTIGVLSAAYPEQSSPGRVTPINSPLFGPSLSKLFENKFK